MVEEKNNLKKETKEEVKEISAKQVRVFTIPLRKTFRKSQPKRVPYAVRIIQQFLQRHLKTDKIKLGKHLNEKLWEKSIKKPPRRVKVNAVLVDDEFRVELVGHKYEEFKSKPTKTKEGLTEKLKARLGEKAIKKEEETKKVEGKIKEAK